MSNANAKRDRVDRDVVIATAADLVNRNGLASLSMGELATALGLKTPSLYAHVTGIDEVKRLLALRGLAAMETALAHAALGKTASSAVRALLFAYLEFVRTNPGVYEATFPAAPLDDLEWTAAARKIQATNRAVLAGLGLSPEEEIHLQRGMRSLAHGFAVFEASGAFRNPVDRDESFSWLVDVFLCGLEPLIGAAAQLSRSVVRTGSDARRIAGGL